MTTRVIHIKDAPPGWRNDPTFVFIGRPSFFGNPYRIPNDGDRETVVRLFIADNAPRLIWDEGYRAAVRALYGQTLVCYCKSKEKPDTPCHGDWLAAQAERLAAEWDAWQSTLVRFKGVDWKQVREEERRFREAQAAAFHQIVVQAREGLPKIRSRRHFFQWYRRYLKPYMKGDRL